jgi:hypothetical protein
MRRRMMTVKQEGLETDGARALNILVRVIPHV